ncbi:hypothetical protein ACLKA6_012771 [Drosophila palustris]
MAETYSSEILRVVIAQIAQTIGYSNTQSAPLELLEDILQRFIQELARDLHSQAEHANRVEPNLKDVQLSLKNLSTDVHELLDYIGNVEPVPFVREVPEYPVKRNSNLNFLKPGSAETLSRPVHIFEYLPPILPTEAGSSSTVRCANPSDLANDQVPPGLERRSEDVKTDFGDTIKPNWCSQRESPLLSRDNADSDGHAVREISSVVMTTGGFISPAIEGKLPEAFVPDIIEKWKGLDAPPASPPPEVPETENTLPTETFLADAASRVSAPETKTRLFAEITTASATNQSKPTKKNKKKHLIGGLHNEHSTDLNASKAQDKAHRKALKMFQKLSKTQAEGDASSKKSMKNLNRGMLSALPDKSTERTQLEKLIKKQTKQRQKQLKSQKQQQQQQRQLQSLNKTAAADGYPAPAFALNPSMPVAPMSMMPLPSANFMPPVAAPVAAPLVGGNNYTFGSPSLIEKKEKFSPGASVEQDAILDEIKLASEPDRNKLNIFKKLSKPKTTPKAPSPMRQLNIATNLFGNASNGSPLINLPSGTTITPAPALNVAENVALNMPAHKVNVTSSLSMATFDDNDPTISQGAVQSLPANSMLTDVHRPKKRGRKPGGKNCVRSTELTPKKQKPNKQSLGLSYPPNLSLVHPMHPLSLPTEPLNLSHVDQFNPPASSVNVGAGEMISHPPVDEQLKCKRVKEKKERKKAKAKYNQFDQLAENALDLNISKKFPFMDADKPMPQTKPALSNEPALINQTSPGVKRMPDSSPQMMGVGVHGYMPGLGALPLLPFPPRPGLIPSGLFSPTSIANFGKKANCPSKLMSHPFISLPAPGRSSTMGYRPTFMETTENKSTGLSEQPLAESALERSYCNVAPLVPDSMKLTSFQMEGSKSTDLKAGDSGELKGRDNAYSSILSKYGPGLLGLAEPAAVQGQETVKQAKTTAGSGNLGDPIEVSDDSNDDAANAQVKKEHNIDAVQQKSSIIQPMNLQPQFESSHPFSMMANSSLSPTIADLKQLKKLTKAAQPIKINQLESSAMSVGPSPSHPTSSFNINFMGNDKFSLAGGADLIPLSCVDSGLAYSSKTVPLTSLAAGATSESSAPPAKTDPEHNYLSNFVGSVNYDDITITPTKTLNDLKLHKLHKKSKKPKEGKIKKKKDKKDKTKSKEKNDDKSLLKMDKPKGLDKKQKKEKKKEKLQVPPDVPQLSKDTIECSTHPTKDIAPKSGLEPVAVTVAETFQTPVPQAMGAAGALATLTHHLPSPRLDLSPNQVPKLTLKLSGKSTPIPPNQSEGEHDNNALITTPTALTKQTKREQSPELARFSPLVTGPPKPKQCETQTLGSTAASAPLAAPSIMQPMPSLIPNTHTTGSGAGAGAGAASNSWMAAAGPACASSSSVSATLSASSVLLPQQLLQASQPMPKMPTTTSLSTLTQSQQSAVSPLKSEGSSVLPQSVESNRPSSYVDAEGYRIWICPACGKVDDGSPMIGCDGCDAWYHWVCVGILVAPNDNEDWFCRVCITKKKVHGSEKKKKRNKKK